MEVDPKLLGAGVKRVLHAAKGTEERHAVIWLDVGPREKFIRIVATDNYRIAVASVPFDEKGDAEPMAIHRDDAVALLHFLARAIQPMKVLPWEGSTRIAFQDPYAALILPNWLAQKPLPAWRKVADQEWTQNVYLNLGFLGDAGTAAGTTGYVKIPSDPKSQPIAFATFDYAEYVMPLRQDETPKDHQEYGVFKL